MRMTLTSVCLFLVGCSLLLETESIDFNQPMSAEEYQSIIGPGFATKYFSQTTKTVLKKYQDKNIEDIAAAGFKNLRLRCSAWMYPYPYDTAEFVEFLDGLERIVDKCLEQNVVAIISWANVDAEANATETDRINYINWWTKVAGRLKDKDYRVGFNLVTELGGVRCKQYDNCNGSLHGNNTKYEIWMSQVMTAIRESGGKNLNRTLILGPPKHSAYGLAEIPKSLYENKPNLMAEYHTYAAGPTGKTSTGRYWDGCGNATQKQNLIDQLTLAKNSTTLPTYWGAWMAHDQKKGLLDQYEVECFAEYFVKTLKEWGTPWSLNALDIYYETSTSTWLSDLQNRTGAMLNMSRVLGVIQKYM